LDLLLYLLSGFGLFILAGTALSGAATVGTLTDSLLRYLLNIVFLGGTTLVLGLARKKITWQQLGLSRWRWGFLLAGILVALVLNPIRGVLGLVSQLLLEGNLESLQMRSDVLTAGGLEGPALFLTLLGVGLLVPVSEELYFRGLLYNWFRERLNLWPAVLLSSALFGLGHADSLGVTVASFIMGVVNALAYQRTGSLWLSIIIHAVTNSSAILLLYLSIHYFP
jgi:membrane protease YdiL (CAAX protease family)